MRRTEGLFCGEVTVIQLQIFRRHLTRLIWRKVVRRKNPIGEWRFLGK
jgi:hypothetical protein